MKIRIAILVLLMGLGLQGIAQHLVPGYQGKRNIFVAQYFAGSNFEYGAYSSRVSIIDSRFTLAYEAILSRRLVLDVTYDLARANLYRYLDRDKMFCHGPGFGFKTYPRGLPAPLGVNLSAGAKLLFVHSNDSLNLGSSSSGIWKTDTSNFGNSQIYLGIGYTNVIAKRIVFDYGLELSLPIWGVKTILGKYDPYENQRLRWFYHYLLNVKIGIGILAF
ncbi:MAG: hypothetical protein H6581_11430 [Bacteroidia bacterium]|nr:hypothetical protein [Bacteroidia bacterium]